jgi:UPF0716 protein FxsA
VLLFVLLLLVIPFVEIFVFVQVASWIGVLDAMGLLLLISLVGVAIVWKQGASAWRRIRNELATGKVPAAALIDGGLIFLAGVLLIIPGYVSDACGLLLLVPPVRAGARGMLRRRYTVQVSGVSGATETWPPPASTPTRTPPEPPAIDV